MNPEYPVYIVSKGRWETRLTAKALEAMSVPYHIVIEPQEYDNYAAAIDPARILIRNDIPYRWCGRYNEDTDLSLRVLKDGWCTFLIQAFVAKKITTMKMKGGNTDELYKDDGRLQMAKSLQEQHPDVVTVSRKWGRYQHQVDYRPFKSNKLVSKPGVTIPEGVNNYGMVISKVDTGKP